jgi:hypothetical protein
MIVNMDIDSHDSAQDQDPLTIGNSHQIPREEANHKTNGIESERTKSDGPRSQPMVGSVQQEEVQLKDITGKIDLGWEEREPEARISSAPTQIKGKQPIA